MGRERATGVRWVTTTCPCNTGLRAFNAHENTLIGWRCRSGRCVTLVTLTVTFFYCFIHCQIFRSIAFHSDGHCVIDHHQLECRYGSGWRTLRVIPIPWCRDTRIHAVAGQKRCIWPDTLQERDEENSGTAAAVELTFTTFALFKSYQLTSTVTVTRVKRCTVTTTAVHCAINV